MYINSEKKGKLQWYGCLIIFFAVFITTYVIRHEIFPCFTMKTFIWGINYIGYFGMILLFMTVSIPYKSVEIVFWLLPIVAIIFPAAAYLSVGKSIGGLAIYVSCCVFPLFLLYVELRPEIREKLLHTFLLLFDIVMVVMLCWAVVDKISGRAVLKFLEPYVVHDQTFKLFAYSESPDHKRFYSVFGHPLINMMWFNMCWVLNIVWNKHHKAIAPSWLVCILGFVAIACCGSKTGFFVGIGITVIAFYKNKAMYIPIGIGIVVMLISGIMDNLLQRLSTSLTTGRMNALLQLLHDSQYPFHLFKGYGENISPHSTAAFEFTVIDMAFCFGIIYAVIMLGLPLLFVIRRCCQAKAFQELLLWGLLFGEANTFYTCLHEQSDNPMIFYFLTMVFLNIILDNWEKKSE